jgi:micrococcal nuclease
VGAAAHRGAGRARPLKSTRLKCALLILAAPLLASGQSPRRVQIPQQSSLTCTVKKLADGDSVTCTDGRKVRLLLIDTPEMQQKPWGLMAKRQLEALAGPGTVLRLELDRNSRDRYGRTLAYAWVGNVMVNERMVANGWAVVLAYEDVRYLERMQRAERVAQSARKGFWKEWAFSCRPVDFRAHRCGDSRG